MENMMNRDKDLIRSEILALVKEYCDQKYLKSAFAPGVSGVPVNGKVIGYEETANIVDSALDGWLTAGRFNEQFEKKLAQYINVSKLITVNSGSSANLVAFMSLTSPSLGARAIKKGDEVISVAAGFPTTINPILQFGAVPVFVDVKLGTYNIDESLVEGAITSKTKAIFIAHTLGNPFNLNAIKSICDKHNLWLIEDCCDALGSEYQGKKVGTFGDIATLSFYPAHHITMGEGGAVFSNNIELMNLATSFRDWGRDCYCETGKDNTCGKRFCWKLGDLPYGYDHKFVYSHVGYNLKVTDMQAACGLAQFDKLDLFAATRKKNFNFLKNLLAECSEDLILPEATIGADPCWFGFPITIKPQSSVNRNDMVEFLNQNKIGTRLLFAGNVTKQPYMKDQIYRVSGTLGNTDVVMNHTFWVGIYQGLNEEMLSYTAAKIKEFIGVGIF
jgi:CDP-6-deoxy-D-xylo-4-hexulose-3-dehydrase